VRSQQLDWSQGAYRSGPGVSEASVHVARTNCHRVLNDDQRKHINVNFDHIDHADICRSCAVLLSTSSMDWIDEQELKCPYPGCDVCFKYQEALDKHISKLEQEGL